MKPEEAGLMNRAAYARHRRVSHQHIYRLAKAGVLVMRGGKVDVAASDAVLDDRPERVSEAATAATVEAGPQSTTYAQAKLADMVFRAKLRRLEFESRSGKLIPMDEVKVQWFKLGRQIRDKLLAMPAKLAPQLAALGDTREVRELLDAEIEAIVRALQDDIRYRRH